MKLFNDFKQAPVATLAEWQNTRVLWAVMSGAALFLLLSAMGYFQVFLEMDPCELCVYIRFSQCSILLGGLIIIINPKNNILKVIGVALALYGIIQGMMWSIELKEIHAAAHMADGGDIFATGGGGAACSTVPKFPLGLPLHEWLPFEFNPTGGCGEDDWSLLGLNMAQYCIIAYGIFAIGLTGAIVGWVSSLLGTKKQDS